MKLQRPFRQAVATAAIACLCSAAQAHFQLLHVEETVLERGQNLEFALVFTHPFSGGPTMAMARPRAFTLISRHGGDNTDLKKYLQPVEWQSKDKRATAFRASVPKTLVRSLGDHVFVLEPEPYLEAEEGLYIQQLTKLIVNVGGVSGQWADPVGLPAEIQPLNRPYANWTGAVFRAVVLSAGEPVPFAKVEVEYLNHSVDLQKQAFGRQAKVTAPHAAYQIMSAYTDAQGVLTIGLPKAGWWGIAALNVGPTKTHEGKPLSQDAVLWVQVKDMK